MKKVLSAFAITLALAACQDATRPEQATEARVEASRAANVAAGKYIVVFNDDEADAKGLARANGLKAPRYTIRPGQRLNLSGCS